MKREERLCLWCQYLDMEAGYAISDDTWESGEIICTKNHWNTIHGDAPLDDVGEQIYTKFRTAINCPDWKLNQNLVNIGVTDE